MAAGQLTKAEVQAMIESILLDGGAGSDLIATFLGLTVDAANNAVAQIRELFSTEIAQSLAGAVQQDLLDAAQSQVLADTKTLVTNLLSAEMQKLSDRIDQGVAAGKHPRDIARDIADNVTELDSVRQAQYDKYLAYLDTTDLTAAQKKAEAEKLFQQLMNDRLETIARTEARKVTGIIAEADALARGATHKRWITRGDDRVSDACQSCEGDGVIKIDAQFSGGVSRVPAHPNCRCTIAYFSDDPTLLKLQKKQAEEAAARTAAAKEG